MKLKREYFDFNGAQSILETKSLLKELEAVFDSSISSSHDIIQYDLSERGWEKEKPILEGTTHKWDAYKNKVVITIEFNGVDAIHRDFFRALLWKELGLLDVLVVITNMSILSSGLSLQALISNIQNYSRILIFPIFAIGIEE